MDSAREDTRDDEDADFFVGAVEISVVLERLLGRVDIGGAVDKRVVLPVATPEVVRDDAAAPVSTSI